MRQTDRGTLELRTKQMWLLSKVESHRRFERVYLLDIRYARSKKSNYRGAQVRNGLPFPTLIRKKRRSIGDVRSKGRRKLLSFERGLGRGLLMALWIITPDNGSRLGHCPHSRIVRFDSPIRELQDLEIGNVKFNNYAAISVSCGEEIPRGVGRTPIFGDRTNDSKSYMTLWDRLEINPSCIVGVSRDRWWDEVGPETRLTQ